MYNQMIFTAVCKARQQDILAEAERDRLLLQVRPARIGLRERGLAGVGGLLISVGKKLQERYTLAMPQGSKA